MCVCVCVCVCVQVNMHKCVYVFLSICFFVCVREKFTCTDKNKQTHPNIDVYNILPTHRYIHGRIYIYIYIYIYIWPKIDR